MNLLSITHIEPEYNRHTFFSIRQARQGLEEEKIYEVNLRFPMGSKISAHLLFLDHLMKVPESSDLEDEKNSQRILRAISGNPCSMRR